MFREQQDYSEAVAHNRMMGLSCAELCKPSPVCVLRRRGQWGPQLGADVTSFVCYNSIPGSVCRMCLLESLARGGRGRATVGQSLREESLGGEGPGTEGIPTHDWASGPRW